MRVVILSRGPELYSTRRLVEACAARGHSTRVLDPLGFSLEMEREKPALFHHNRRVGCDAVIPRIGASVTAYGTAVVRHFEQMGVFCLASAQAIAASRDKLRSCQILSRHRIGMPKTVAVRCPEDILPAIERLGGTPVIIKLLEGTQGTGVILADTPKVAEAIVETLQGPGGTNVLIQQFVAESRGRDIRAFVVGGRVVAAMRRIASGDEYRSNVHRGGRMEAVELDAEYRRTAVQAAQIIGLRVAGVDMLEGRGGPLVTEVNASPGLEGIEQATGIDVAGAITRHLEEAASFPEVDIRQRLTLDEGWGISEVVVDAGGPLAGRTLAELALGERDVVVLSVMRGEAATPNPSGDTRLAAGDALVCFGNLASLKQLASGVRRGDAEAVPPSSREQVRAARVRRAG